MIHKLILSNFKSIKNQTFAFSNFDLVVGANNSGKSTILQALAIWQYCVNEFKLSNRKSGNTGIQVVLPNFTALPLPIFNLLWNDRIAHAGKKFILIDIDVYWKDATNTEQHFCVQLRYQSPQAIFAIPQNGWSDFIAKTNLPSFPKIVYVPPFSGLEPNEEWRDEGGVKQQIGKAHPGSVLRNLLFRVVDRPNNIKNNDDWKEIVGKIKEWFNVDLLAPQYIKGGNNPFIFSEYQVNKKTFDIISGGSGFHQILTLLAFVYGYPEIGTILFDEPDAHLHVNLQKQIIQYFQNKTHKQFIIATHSEEFINKVPPTNILSILSGEPVRPSTTPKIISALRDIENNDIVRTQASPYILYIEGEDDQRLLATWAKIIGQEILYQKFYTYVLNGGSKKGMKDWADTHFEALRQIVPNVKRAILLDYDDDTLAINPTPSNITLNEWKRKNIDNYLLVPDAWKRAITKKTGLAVNDLAIQAEIKQIDDFFADEGLMLPPNTTWKDVSMTAFKYIDGKKRLFEDNNSLFQQIKQQSNKLILNREAIASCMDKTEIHNDIEHFFNNLSQIATPNTP